MTLVIRIVLHTATTAVQYSFILSEILRSNHFIVNINFFGEKNMILYYRFFYSASVWNNPISKIYFENQIWCWIISASILKTEFSFPIFLAIGKDLSVFNIQNS